MQFLLYPYCLKVPTNSLGDFARAPLPNSARVPARRELRALPLGSPALRFACFMPAKNDRKKYRIAGISERTRNAWTSRKARLIHTFCRPCMPAPFACHIARCCHARTTRETHRTRHPLFCFRSRIPADVFFALAIIPFGGLPLSRRWTSAVCLTWGSVKGASVPCLTAGDALTIPVRRTVFFCARKKHALGEMGIPARPGACGVMCAENLIMLECPHTVRA